jgi:cytochrome d ubiquinol oxidase subunit I
MVALGAVVAGFFIVATDAWMQHPVAYTLVNGNAQLDSLWGLLTNPYALWQYPHTISGSMITASMVMAGVGAYYLLSRRFEDAGRMCVKVGVVSGLLFSLLSLFPTGAKNGEQVTQYQPIKMAAMEGLFKTQEGAPMAIIGMPDTGRRELMDPIFVPRVLSYLAYGDFRAKVVGLDDYPRDLHPPIELVYYAYHIMVGLGTIFIGIMALVVFLLWRGLLYRARWFLWILMLAVPFPYIANQAGWTVAEVGRQPWVVYGLQRTAEATSPNVSSGMAIFTLLGFMGLYALLGIVYLALFAKIVNEGPVDHEQG